MTLQSMGGCFHVFLDHFIRDITFYVIGFAGTMRSLNTLSSFHNNENIVWDIGAYSLIAEMRFYVTMASNESMNIIWLNSTILKKYVSVVSCISRYIYFIFSSWIEYILLIYLFFSSETDHM